MFEQVVSWWLREGYVYIYLHDCLYAGYPSVALSACSQSLPPKVGHVIEMSGLDVVGS